MGPWSGSVADTSFLPLNSLPFLGLIAVAVVALRCCLHGVRRRLAVLSLNLCFLQFFVADWLPLGLAALLILFTYAGTRLRASSAGPRIPVWLWIGAVLLLWAFLFVVKGLPGLSSGNSVVARPIFLIGMSYMVFRCIAVLMDAEDQPPLDLLSFVNYLLFFPTLIAGPIESYERFRQFESADDLNLNESPMPALHRVANGFLKKFVLADNLAMLGLTVDVPFSEWSLPARWLGVIILPVLLYLDFSGYCDIMIGLVRLLGFRLAENFDRPWRAANIQDFWNRWHITLSQFIRNYVFNPLWCWVARYARPHWQFPLALLLYFATMVLIGIWHGLTWGFFAFGLLHAVALVSVLLVHRYAYPALPAPTLAWVRSSRLMAVGGGVLTWGVVSLSMVLWCHGTERSWSVVRSLFGA
jgi:alginate O-acetyltransferase complex protein AlgI